MSSTYTDILRLELPTTGELDATWGSRVNTGITALIETALAGTTAVTHTNAADYTLTTASGAADEARAMFLNVGGALTAARNVVCPTKSKLYFVRNATTGGFAFTLKTAAGTGISVPNGKYMMLYCDGTNVVEAVNYSGNFQPLDADLTTWAGITPGIGVATALAVNVGTAGAPVINGGALGTPASGTLTGCTGLPAAGVTGTALVAAAIGTTVQAYDADLATWAGITPGIGVATALAVNVGTAGAPVINGGALGTPSSGNGTNITNVNAATLGGATFAAPAPIGATTPAAGNFTTIHVPGGGTISTNEAFGTGALGSNTTGGYNVASGMNALAANTTGNYNVASGANALLNNIGGSGNTANGFQALKYNTTGTNNTASGQAALQANTGGGSNVASGYQALAANTTGGYNVASGVNALQSSTTGSNNTASGYQALVSNTTGYNNTASGYAALYSNTAGHNNTASGREALFFNTTGSGNTAMNPWTATDTYSPVFNPTTENDRFCMGSTAVTNAYINVAWTIVSDLRDKRDIGTVPHGLDFVTKLNPVSYRRKLSREDDTPNGPVRYGFIAQEVLPLEGSTPVIIDAEDPERLRLVDNNLMAVMVKAIQELKSEFDAYKLTHP